MFGTGECTYGHDMQKHPTHIMTMPFMLPTMAMCMAMIMQIRDMCASMTVIMPMMRSEMRITPELVARRER